MKIKDFILNWGWELLQNLIGKLNMVIVNKDISSIYTTTEGKKVIKVACMKGGVALGKYVFINDMYPSIYTEHELGHTKQSRILGPLYLVVIGIPSLIHNWLYNKWFKNRWNYYNFYTEKWANKLAGITLKTN